MHTAFVVIAIFGSLLFIIPFNTLFHEAGHAIAMAMLTQAPVTIFLGSYGDTTNSRQLRLGLFIIWVQRNPLKWKGGLCMPEATDISIRKQIWCTLAGPLATLLLFLILLSIFVALRPTGIAAPFLSLFCIYSGLSFLYNIIPLETAIGLKRGELTYNDGTKLRRLLAHQQMPPAWFEALQNYEEGKYEMAAGQLEALISSGIKNEDAYRLAIESFIQIKSYPRANAIQKAQIARYGHLNMHDRIHMAAIKIGLGKYDEAVGYLKHLLELYGPNKYNFVNLGYVLTLTAQYEEAIPYLTKAIAIDDKFACAYSTRAFAHLQLGSIKEGKDDNDLSLHLDPENADAYRNSGLYHLHMRNYGLALTAFEKAASIDRDIIGLHKLLAEAHAKLSASEPSPAAS